MYTSKLISLVKTIENKINYLSLQKKHLPEPEFKKLKYTLSIQKDEYCNYYKTYYDIFMLIFNTTTVPPLNGLLLKYNVYIKKMLELRQLYLNCSKHNIQGLLNIFTIDDLDIEQLKIYSLKIWDDEINNFDIEFGINILYILDFTMQNIYNDINLLIIDLNKYDPEYNNLNIIFSLFNQFILLQYVYKSIYILIDNDYTDILYYPCHSNIITYTYWITTSKSLYNNIYTLLIDYLKITDNIDYFIINNIWKTILYSPFTGEKIDLELHIEAKDVKYDFKKILELF